MIEREPHEERTETTRQDKRAERESKRRAQRAQPEITADEVRDKIRLGSKSEPHQERAHERGQAGRAGPQ